MKEVKSTEQQISDDSRSLEELFFNEENCLPVSERISLFGIAF